MTENAHTWADSVGNWHASVPIGPYQEQEAYEAIAALIITGDTDNSDPRRYVSRFMTVRLVPDLSSATRAVYTEHWPTDEEVADA